jgi:predicted NUDIX family NTP pyrophosphohydrolase
MPRLIASGLLMCRWNSDVLEYFLVHPGGPFFKNKDEGVWSIPKGLPEPGEDLLTTAQREFTEETGLVATPPYHALSPVTQKAGKLVHAWTFLGDWNPSKGIVSNNFKTEWPPRSGKFQEFPEQDRAEWMTLETAKTHINPAQVALLDEAEKIHREIKSSDRP